MKSLSRGTWLTLAAMAAIPATVALAASGERGWHRMSDGARERLDEGKLAMAKAALKLTPEQDKLWQPIEGQLRDAYKTRTERRAEWKKLREERQAARKDGKEQPRPNMAERFEKMSKRMSERADKFKAFSSAFSPFYASLNDEQKEVLRPLMRDLAPFDGKRGGPRWASRGWGPEGGPRGHHHRWGGRDDGDRGGPPAERDEGPDGDGGAPGQSTPDKG